MDKDKLEVLLSTDSDGYIIGYQKEFWDGSSWQTPFDTTDAVLMDTTSIDSIVLGAAKLNSDNTVTLDTNKQAEIEKANNVPSLESQVTDLQSQNAQLQSALLELADTVLK